jgi:hypothetical protein
MKNIHDEILDNQDDDLRYQGGNNYNEIDPEDDDLIDDEDEDFDIETGDDIDDDVDDELISTDTVTDDDEWDDDDDLLSDDEEEDDDLVASADDDDSEKSVTHDTSFNTGFESRPHGRTTGRMTDHNPGTTGFTTNTD